MLEHDQTCPIWTLDRAGGYLGTHTFKCGLLAECQFVDTKINC